MVVNTSRKPRFRGYPATRIHSHLSDFRTVQTHSFTSCRGTTPCAHHRRSSAIFYTSVFQLLPPPPALPLALLSWTPMETVASWHGEVNYKRYQSLGVVGWLVGLGSTDSQLPLRADPRARAIPSSLHSPSLHSSLSLCFSPALSFLLFLSLPRYHLARLFLSCSLAPCFLPSFVDPSSSVTSQDGLTPQALYNPQGVIYLL